jgi:hypothetical protein
MSDAKQAKIDAWLSEQEALMGEVAYARFAELVKRKEVDEPATRMIRLCAVEVVLAFMDNTPESESTKDYMLQKDFLSTLMLVTNISNFIVDKCTQNCSLGEEAGDWFPVSHIAYMALGGALQLLGDVNAEALHETLAQPMSNFIVPE